MPPQTNPLQQAPNLTTTNNDSSASSLQQQYLQFASKEAETIKIPNYPNISTIQQWREGLGVVLMQASRFSDTAEIAWINEVPHPYSTYESLHVSGDIRFHGLDAKLSVAINTS